MPLKKLGHVVLKVRDLDRSEAFYTEVVGLRVSGRLPGRMVFFSVPGNDDSHDLAIWNVGPDAAAPQPKQVGLFHIAWQVERPEDLETLYGHLVAKGARLHGTTDHGANLSVYFEDPDGNMLEFTYEQPRESWPPGRNPFAGREPLPFETARIGR
ncbi:MAG TPA: VOC family protein [Methylomirabilota bacterium]|jgi:catechol-2,3-dioxygenase|nr:VOC family protein [Methylomirabilota bacterium]